MTKTVNWVAWERCGGISARMRSIIIKKSDEDRPDGRGWKRRTPTNYEVYEELAKRHNHVQKIESYLAFNARPDVIAARRVMSSIDIELGRILDRLTPEEWAALADRLDRRGKL